MSKLVNVILSGGFGTRLWPLSTPEHPKQFLRLFNNKSLFQHTISRNQWLVDDFLLITNKKQVNQAKDQFNELSKVDLDCLIEPVGRNTAPAIAIAAWSLNPEDIMFVTPCDHMIADEKLYKKALNRAVELAESGSLVTFGIKPLSPDTGFGYIEHDHEEVLSFREKPDFKTAKQFLQSKKFLWNSGMFCFKVDTFLKELEIHSPDIYQASKIAFLSINNSQIAEPEMQAIPEDSIDYAVFEKSDKIKTIPSGFYWTDLGSYDALINYFQNHSKYIDGVSNLEGIEVNNSFYIGNKKAYGLHVSDLIVVETEENILVMQQGKSQDVKKIIKY